MVVTASPYLLPAYVHILSNSDSRRDRCLLAEVLADFGSCDELNLGTWVQRVFAAIIVICFIQQATPWLDSWNQGHVPPGLTGQMVKASGVAA